MDNTFPGKTVNVAPVIGAALAAMTNPVSTMMGESQQLAKDLGVSTSNAAGLSLLPGNDENQNKTVQPKVYSKDVVNQ